MAENAVTSKLKLWWDEGYISWGGIAVAAACVLLGVLYAFRIIDRIALILLSGLLVVAADVVGYVDNRRHGRPFNATICLLSVVFDLLFL